METHFKNSRVFKTKCPLFNSGVVNPQCVNHNTNICIKMAKTGDSSTKKPRKKRSSINFKTTKEKEKSKTRLIQQNISSYGHGDPSASSSKENSTETVIATADRRGKTNTTRSKSHRFTSPSKPLSSRNEVGTQLAYCDFVACSLFIYLFPLLLLHVISYIIILLIIYLL